MAARPYKTRFAPSPTGRLHLGNVRTALFNYLLARRAGGVFLLRLEDSDAVRGHEKYDAAIREDLRWLGLDWDEGPETGGPHGPYRQSERGTIYRDYFARLEAQGLAYPCFCSEHELAVERRTALAAGRPPRYSGRCRALSREQVAARFVRGEPATLRFRVPDDRVVEFEDKVRGRQTFHTDDIGDFVIRRSDGTPAFFFCNAVDDALMGVTLVVRGEDHLANTPRQILLLEALALPVPEYAHIALVVDAAGAPLAKRTGSLSVEALRARGFLPAAVVNYLARLGHTYESNALMSLEQLAAGFALERLHRSPARYDEGQLLHWQREALRALPAETLWAWMREALEALVPEARRAAFVAAVRDNIAFPSDARRWAEILLGDRLSVSHQARVAIEEAGSEFFAQAATVWDETVERPAFETTTRQGEVLSGEEARIRHFLDRLATATGYRGQALYRPLRAALTGQLEGPELAKILPLMGVERIRQRLAKYL